MAECQTAVTEPYTAVTPWCLTKAATDGLVSRAHYFPCRWLSTATKTHKQPCRRPQVRDSALRPLDGDGWWKEADSPWQCLAVCKDLTAALDSPDPTQYLSSLSVHQDGE